MTRGMAEFVCVNFGEDLGQGNLVFGDRFQLIVDRLFLSLFQRDIQERSHRIRWN